MWKVLNGNYSMIRSTVIYIQRFRSLCPASRSTKSSLQLSILPPARKSKAIMGTHLFVWKATTVSCSMTKFSYHHSLFQELCILTRHTATRMKCAPRIQRISVCSMMAIHLTRWPFLTLAATKAAYPHTISKFILWSI